MLPATSELVRRYSVIGAALDSYEADMKEIWMKQNVSVTGCRSYVRYAECLRYTVTYSVSHV